MGTLFSTRIKDAGIAIRHSRGRILFYTARSRNGLGRVVGGGPGHEIFRKVYFFLTGIETYIEDARQDEKHVPDLLEAIMRPTDPVKGKLQPFFFKMIQFGSKIQKIRVSTSWIPEIQSFPARGQCQPAR